MFQQILLFIEWILDQSSSLSFFLLCIVFLANNVLTYGILLAYTLIMISLSKIPIRFILNGLIPVLWLVVFTLFIHLFFTREGELIVNLGWFKIYEEGLRQGVFISLRFFLLDFSDIVINTHDNTY